MMGCIVGRAGEWYLEKVFDRFPDEGVESFPVRNQGV
jgi:hypothetical protein